MVTDLAPRPKVVLMTASARKFALTAHVMCSVGWLGAVVAFEALAVAALTSPDVQLVRAAYVAMQPITWYAIVPLALASLLTGLVVSFGTQWGLLRHYWVAMKFVINIFAIVILLRNTRQIAFVANAAAQGLLFGADMRGPGIRPIVVAGVALLALALATTLSIYKPRGMTPYGRRKELNRATNRREIMRRKEDL